MPNVDSFPLLAFSTDSRVYSFDFSQRLEIQNGDTIVSTVVSLVSGPDNTLVLGTPSITGNFVLLNLSGGIIGIYQLKCVVDLASGSRLTCLGNLEIEL